MAGYVQYQMNGMLNTYNLLMGCPRARKASFPTNNLKNIFIHRLKYRNRFAMK